eukprot:CAMPEP_0113515862 /NCGR_PEP_ID=MMETSP0014_2-20120614/41225_1 /TAXON_ID=2857 /ORGANISM="Nitzschia sp." /LENGTH=619 /DNA_ID=CAMNT_0000412567 /DNA_START=156 /DNA_END=2012 /DNA_ORIENTATION=- /assembly_acc=CAM_ASM_000159
MPKPKKILNDPTKSVEEFISGLLFQYPNSLVKLQNHNVVLTSKKPLSSKTVQLLSGGGSGHEPSHAGWIGSGMLSGAILGGIFASPSVASILAAVRAASVAAAAAAAESDSDDDTNKSPVLLVVKNYTGDRLNFGMACEMANQEGIPTQMVIVADDCAVPRTKGITGARGVAGTVLVHKIAGAAAADTTQGKSLDDVVSIVQQVSSQMGTLGVSLDNVTVPGAETVNDRLDDETIEIGLGIHGEAGLKQSPLLTADEIAKEMIDTIRDFGRTITDPKDGSSSIVPLFENGDELCVLVNNLGGTSNFEMSILANSCVTYLESQFDGCKVSRLLVGSFMTSFDMHGASVTILNLSGMSNDLIGYLDAPTDAPAWMACDVWKDPSSASRPSATERPEVVVDDGNSKLSRANLPALKFADFAETSKAMILKATQTLAANEALLTKYDTIVGDGDCGITMKRGATEVEKRINNGKLSTDHPVVLFSNMADAISDSMGGTSGVLLELMFRKMSSTLSGFDNIGPSEMAKAFNAGVDGVQLYGGATKGSRTMLDALIPAAETLLATGSLYEASSKAKWGADGTADMKSAEAGRSNYVSEETLIGTPDPGAEAVAIVFEALSPFEAT